MYGAKIDYTCYIHFNYDPADNAYIASRLGIEYEGDKWSDTFGVVMEGVLDPLHGVIHYNFKTLEIFIPSTRPDLYVKLAKHIPFLLDIRSSLPTTWFISMRGTLTVPFTIEEYLKNLKDVMCSLDGFGISRPPEMSYKIPYFTKGSNYYLRMDCSGTIWFYPTEVSSLKDVHTILTNVRKMCETIVTRLDRANPQTCIKVDNSSDQPHVKT